MQPQYDDCLATIRAYKHGGKPGLMVLQKVLPAVFATYYITDSSMQLDILCKCKLNGYFDEKGVSFMLQDGIYDVY